MDIYFYISLTFSNGGAANVYGFAILLVNALSSFSTSVEVQAAGFIYEALEILQISAKAIVFIISFLWFADTGIENYFVMR